MHCEEFADAGADYVIGGMAVGSICQTGSRGNGRGQFTVAHELAEARDKYAAQSGGRYVPIVIDGGIKTIKDMVVALAFGDFIVMCNYFNAFYEAAAKKLDENKKETSEEALIRFVETWGEGHPRARLVAMFGMNYKEALEQLDPKEAASVLERYGQSSVASATVEGVVGLVNYRGRLKPCVEDDARYLRATISNAGAKNLAEFREKAIVEKISPETLVDLKPHDIEVTES
jgi:IMP dehydrogenase